jgi:hypothetical protein
LGDLGTQFLIGFEEAVKWIELVNATIQRRVFCDEFTCSYEDGNHRSFEIHLTWSRKIVACNWLVRRTE